MIRGGALGHSERSWFSSGVKNLNTPENQILPNVIWDEVTLAIHLWWDYQRRRHRSASVMTRIFGHQPYLTKVAMRCWRVCPASAQNPVWTGEVCTTVLRGAVSQRKRSPAGNTPIDPVSALPLHTSSNMHRCASISGMFTSPCNARRRCSFSSNAIWRNSWAAQYRMMPTFRNSSRSTRGTTRTMAYSNTSLSCTIRLLNQSTRHCKSPLQECRKHLPFPFRG